MSTRHADTQPFIISTRLQWLFALSVAAIVGGVAYWSGPETGAIARGAAAALAGAILAGAVLFALKRMQIAASVTQQQHDPAGMASDSLVHREVKPQSAGSPPELDQSREASRTRSALYESGTRMVSSGYARASRASRSGHDL